MDTNIYTKKDLKLAAKDINDGQLVSFPTETVYGLGADATNEKAVKAVYAAKGRPSDNPLIVHVDGPDMVKQYAQPLLPEAQSLLDTFWPGPLTIIFKLKPNVLSKAVTGGLDTAAFRNPNNDVTLSLIREAGVPIVGPSANTSGKPSPTKAEHVYHDLKGKIAGILDDGESKYGVESTVLDMSTDKPAILRPGAITADQISKVINKPVLDQRTKVADDQVPKAPGMKYKHYAPNAQVYIVDDEDEWQEAVDWAAKQDHPVGIMADNHNINGYDWSDNVETFSLGDNVNSASHLLFAGLRHFDNEPEVKSILTQAFSSYGIGEAYMNRLNKSAGQVHFHLR
ncbi:L-threonylcarbamoyladenylate synthase [Apilactobacillus timberlakei]|uniref:Threonylcarbamoyl-AMP synthase n=1 Tax=Apilactobacillus timberlakei TaxID=2008380 RepID=A0ABY2YSJ0_9LACO|nr:L-threonylcarbamoyladenylate synthase [Apilactobacillus timberlakei]TPR12635.1 threonylcarbamoyl-AMP synthase [Apilactobacillus timberlakei]TPR13464.1 threonylcarbamoyl-AMP synthase [Apilactobacillus timberlakei]TPR15537.1 threonylcarbamoyl-AMP synthase [Apilactobacillus timberlakei]TPR17785.1 threonylcarbamoyl-AMP synthase [Apilactobacillus timberlakei]